MLLRTTLLALALSVNVLPAAADGGSVRVQPNAAHRFATLPAGVVFPEGIAANPASGEIYVATFSFGADNWLLRLSRSGRVLAMRNMGASPLLGLAFDASSGRLYLCNFGASAIQRIAGDFGPASPVEEVVGVPQIGAPGPRTVGNPDGTQDTIEFGNVFPAPNALAFDSGGDLYFSDSFQGAVFRLPDPAANCPGGAGCVVEVIAHDPLLATAGFPPFGANGLALSPDEATLFVANTGDDRVLQVDLASGEASVFAESVNGADGLAMASDGTLWVAANQADQIVGLDADGRVVAELGEFLGVRRDGTARGLSFPASIVIAGERMFVTNLSLPLTESIGDEPEEDITRYTISRVNLP